MGKHRHGIDPSALVRRSLWIAGSLAALKTATGLATGSLAVLASALDSILDLCSSLVNFVSIRIARSPADSDHQYGHDKAEALAGLFQGAFITLGAGALFVESVRRLLVGATLEHSGWSVAIMLVSMVASLLHGTELQRAAKSEESNILGVEGAHFLSDVASNLGIAIALGLVAWTGKTYWDPLVTTFVVVYILRSTVPIITGSVAELMDEGLPAETRAAVESLITNHHPSVVGFHNFRSRRAGTRRYIEFHLELRGVTEFIAAHDITEALVDKIKAAVPNADVLIHSDPEGAK